MTNARRKSEETNLIEADERRSGNCGGARAMTTSHPPRPALTRTFFCPLPRFAPPHPSLSFSPITFVVANSYSTLTTTTPRRARDPHLAIRAPRHGLAVPVKGRSWRVDICLRHTSTCNMEKPKRPHARAAIHHKPRTLTAPDKPTRPPAKQPEAIQPDVEGSIVQISRTGDIVLHIQAEDRDETVLMRVDGRLLSNLSPYFAQLLSTRFEEGTVVAARHAQLLQTHASLAEVPSDDLPKVKITDIGSTSRLKSPRQLLVDLMLLLHGRDMASARPPLVNLANLVVVADRFLVADVLARTVTMKLLLGERRYGAADEETTRQKLMIGLLLRNEAWTLRHSAKLLLDGSVLWPDDDNDDGDDDDDPDLAPPSPTTPPRALWWSLPNSIDSELRLRRRRILSALFSLQHFHLSLYSERGSRQCKLGYDTSPQCDSFQLGEFVKFLVRCGTLSFSPHPSAAAGASGKPRSIKLLIDTLRQCPSYQLDANHAHCGPRKSWLAGLEHIEALLADKAVGLCLAPRAPGAGLFHDSWAHPPEPRASVSSPACANQAAHAAARDLFLSGGAGVGGVPDWSFLLAPVGANPTAQLGLRFGSMSFLK